MLPNLMLYLLLLLDLSLLQAVHLFLVEYFIMQVFSESMSSSPVGRTRAVADLPEPMDLCC